MENRELLFTIYIFKCLFSKMNSIPAENEIERFINYKPICSVPNLTLIVSFQTISINKNRTKWNQKLFSFSSFDVFKIRAV